MTTTYEKGNTVNNIIRSLYIDNWNIHLGNRGKNSHGEIIPQLYLKCSRPGKNQLIQLNTAFTLKLQSEENQGNYNDKEIYINNHTLPPVLNKVLSYHIKSVFLSKLSIESRSHNFHQLCKYYFTEKSSNFNCCDLSFLKETFLLSISKDYVKIFGKNDEGEPKFIICYIELDSFHGSIVEEAESEILAGEMAAFGSSRP